MNASTPRARILHKIKVALSKGTELPFPNLLGNETKFNENTNDLLGMFEAEFTRLLGRFSYCESIQEVSDQVAALLAKNGWENVYCTNNLPTELIANVSGQINESNVHSIDAAITDCECLISRTGSAVLSSAQVHGRIMSVYAPVHIIIAYTDQLLYNVADGIAFVQQKYGKKLPSLLTITSGPSRTGDIEKTLIVGVHGPKNVYLYLLPRNKKKE